MEQKPVIINYSLGEATRRKNQQKDFSLASTSWTVAPAGIECVKEVEQPIKQEINIFDPIFVLSKSLKTVLELQEFMYENFDKYKS